MESAAVLDAGRPSGQIDRAERPRAPLFRIASVLAVAVPVAFSLVLTIAALSTSHGLYGETEYDDGVYFGAALRLVTGALPYRDFTLVQPPGIAVVMAPVALLAHPFGTAKAMAIARVLTAVVAVFNVALVALLLRRRIGRLAAAVGGLTLALWPPAYFADHTLLLEPYLVALCLIGLLAIFWRAEGPTARLALCGGVAFGVAGTIKVWAIVPAVIVAVMLAPAVRARVLPFFAGTAAGFVVVCAPFFVAAPGAFVHDVVFAQLGRGTTGPISYPKRLWDLMGLRGVGVHLTFKAHGDTIYVLAAVLAALAIFGGLLPAVRKRATRFEVFALAAGAAVFLVIILPPSFYTHYTYFWALFLALCLGCWATRAVSALRRALERIAGAGRSTSFGIGGVAIAIALFGLGVSHLLPSEMRYDRSEIRHTAAAGSTIESLVPPGACAVTDAEDFLIEANRFYATSARCPLQVDPSGTWIAADPAHPPGAGSPPVPSLVATWQHFFAIAQYAVLTGPNGFRIPWTPALRGQFNADFHLEVAHGAYVFKRSG